MLGWKDPLDSSISIGFPWITTATTPFSLVIGQRVPLYFGFLLSELQGSLSKLLVKKPTKGPTVIGRVLDIGILQNKGFFLSSSVGGLDTVNGLTIPSLIHLSKT